LLLDFIGPVLYLARGGCSDHFQKGTDNLGIEANTGLGGQIKERCPFGPGGPVRAIAAGAQRSSGMGQPVKLSFSRRRARSLSVSLCLILISS
jgi:hypothetical protein